MKVSRTTILERIGTYSTSQLERLQDTICRNVASGKIGTCWHEVINAIDAELDRRIGCLPPYWALVA